MVRETRSHFDFNWFSDDIARRLAAGEHPQADDYVARFPGHEEEIREAYPVLCVLAEQTPDVVHDRVRPETINGYQIVREIGRGGMGIVYEATHPKLTRKMAIKVLTPAQAGKSTLQERFAREAETASRLSHPHIVPLFDFGESDNQAFLVMPFIEGRGLDELLEDYWKDRDEFSEEIESSGRVAEHQAATGENFIASDYARIATLGAQAASALAHAHDHHAIHRDIKPANLILDRNQKVWVTDFGLAKLRDADSDLSMTGDIIGTPRYMAPEQIRGQSDERSDIYSLGVTLWEMAAGKRAWEAVNHGDMLAVKTSFDLPPVQEMNPDVPNGLSRIIGRCCAFQPKHRFQSAGDLQQELNRFAHRGEDTDRRFRGGGIPRKAKSGSTLLPTALVAIGILATCLLYNSPTAFFRPHNRPARITNASPVYGTDLTLISTVATGETDLKELYTTASDPEGDSFSWQLLNGPDSHGFVVQRLTGHVCFRKPAFVEPTTSINSQFDLQLIATDLEQPHVCLASDGRDGVVLLSVHTGEVVKSLSIPGQVLGITTLDGRVFRHVHLSNDGTVALYSSSFTGGLWNTRLEQSDCRLSPHLQGIAQHSKSEFLSVVRGRQASFLQWLNLEEDNTFSITGRKLELPESFHPSGLSCLGEFDFQLIERRHDDMKLREIVVTRNRIAGTRDLSVRWPLGDQRVHGMTAWLTRRAGIRKNGQAALNLKVRPASARGD